MISENKTIKKIIIVKKYNDLRLTKSLQDSLIVFMESFPLHNFWEHVLIINTWANPNDENFINFMEENPQKFNDKILNCQYLLDYMKEKDIKLPSEIKEYFIDSYIYIKKNKLKKEFEQIKNDILNSKIMFKKVETSDILEETIESETKMIYIVKKYRQINCTDFDGRVTTIIQKIGENEVSPNDTNKFKTEKKSQFVGKDCFRFYDYCTLFITYLIRKTDKYNVQDEDFHKIGNKEIIIQKNKRIEWR